jgi:hypothetical protein
VQSAGIEAVFAFGLRVRWIGHSFLSYFIGSADVGY